MAEPEAQIVARIRAGMLAFAAGDAFGVPWEGVAPADLRGADLASLPRREDWPRGTTSDDTAQMLLAAAVLGGTGGDPRRPFLEGLAAELPRMRGAGPTTTAAVRRWEESGLLEAVEGSTNGAAMRALPVGWATRGDDPEKRQRRVLALSRATHGAPGALVAAGVVAAMGSWSLEGCSLGTIREAAHAEAVALAGALGAEDALAPLEAAARGSWLPPSGGVSMDAVETLAAVLHVLARSGRLPDGFEAAVRFGGDTDTVAAIVAGILGVREAGSWAPPPWFDLVQLPDASRVERLASGLALARG
jgi:ADP-ribosyl-[dinitrogen reductase] hydrolase